MRVISEEAALLLVNRLSWMPGFQGESDEFVAALKAALMQVSRSDAHAREIVDRLAEDCERCPMPKHIIEAGNSMNSAPSSMAGCRTCNGDGFVYTGDYDGRIGRVQVCECRRKTA